jgi:hypothetical protein
VKDAAKVAGIAERTLWRAVNRLRVKTNDRTAFGPGHPSRWSLPSLLNPPDFIGTVDTVGNVGTVGVDVPSIPSVPRDLPTEPYGTQIARAREASNGLPADWLEQDDARRLALLDAGRRRLELSPRRRR